MQTGRNLRHVHSLAIPNSQISQGIKLSDRSSQRKRLIMLLLAITIKSIGRAKQGVAAGSTNSVDRWIHQEVSLSSSVVTFVKDACLEERFEICTLGFLCY
jgi:hypothetical protein